MLSILENDESYNHIFNYASELMDIKYLTDVSKNISKSTIRYLNENVNRSQAVGNMSIILKDIECAIFIEAGIFEFTLIYGKNNNMIKELLSAIYYDKLNEIIYNIDTDSPIDNNNLKIIMINRQIPLQEVAFMKPQELFPERWIDMIKKADLREEKKNNIATTDVYQCKKCHERKCKVMELQTRSIDEPSTKFITCLVCYHVMKK